MAPISSLLWRRLRVHQVYGANTDVGKTIFTTVLCRVAAKLWKDEHTSFLKPVSTGAAQDADSCHISKYSPSTLNETLVQYDEPCSPHSAARSSGRSIPSDASLLTFISEHISRRAAQGPGWLFLETAGGVHSPGPSGTSQADLYAPLRAPVILVGDSKLGGISQTIAAFESLKLRGYDVEALLLFQDTKYENYLYLRDYFSTRFGILVETAPTPPPRCNDDHLETESMQSYYDSVDSSGAAAGVLETLDCRGRDRIARLESMRDKASTTIWYPFTQQKLLTPDRISVIDSAYGDYFQVFNPDTPATASGGGQNQALLQPAFDGSASWWTQGLGHANPQLTLAAAYAAGRYGHVMFAEAIHEPALALAETLLRGLNNPRLSRVFYSDNGSTGCEVAVKMALRAARLRYGWGPDERIEILGLKGSYHGDTIGVMDCAEPCAYNEKIEWYEGKGFWFDYPTVRCTEGVWRVDIPEPLQREMGSDEQFDALSEVFDLGSRTQDGAFQVYKRYIRDTLEHLHVQGRKFGALMLEPVVLGAGGMNLVDPLFQKALVEVVRTSAHLFGAADKNLPVDEQSWSGLPVVFDEVFTGLYRLGRFSASSLLDTHPDVSVHAKLLTGGLVPLCATLASESIFDAFSSEDKSDALLHGHSYTAHAVGCQVALESLKEMQSMEEQGSWGWAENNGWTAQKASDAGPSSAIPAGSDAYRPVWAMWSRDFVENVSQRTDKVTGMWALGSVLAISMRDDKGSGYKSNAAASLQAHLREGTGSWNAHTRVLGNVFYVMASQKTTQQTISELQNLIVKALDA